MKKTYYLKDKDGYIIAKFEMVDDYFSGDCYECVGWQHDGKSPCEWHYHSEMFAKFDGCTHWYFKGEDYNKENEEGNCDGIDSYYHLCGSDCFENHIRFMCFVWKIAGNYHKERLLEESLLIDYTKKEYDSELVDYVLKGYEIICVESE